MSNNYPVIYNTARLLWSVDLVPVVTGEFCIDA